VTEEEWKEFDTPEGFWKKMVEVAHRPEYKNNRRHEATRWAGAEMAWLRAILDMTETCLQSMVIKASDTNDYARNMQKGLSEERRRARGGGKEEG
jgi:hypothetical protein